MSAIEALRLARQSGIHLALSGGDLILDASHEPAPTVLEAIRQHKAGIIALLAAEQTEWTVEQVAAVLVWSEYGAVWLARDEEAALQLIAELERAAPSTPVVTFDEAALLGGKSDRMLRAALTAIAELPGSRLLQ